MGLPSFYGWAIRHVRLVKERRIQGHMDSENVYIDMNGLIHPAVHADGTSLWKSEEERMDAIILKLEEVLQVTRPQKVLYLAIDGVAPSSKLNQQRARRIRSIRDLDENQLLEEDLRAMKYASGEPCPPKEEVKHDFDSNVITPGTEFMTSLGKKLEEYIVNELEKANSPQSLEEDHREEGNKSGQEKKSIWKGLQVILSDASVPGEGEHKLLEFIREQEAEKQDDTDSQNTEDEQVQDEDKQVKKEQIVNRTYKHVLVGEDADLFMLGLATHKSRVAVLRNTSRVEDMIEKWKLKHQWNPKDLYKPKNSGSIDKKVERNTTKDKVQKENFAEEYKLIDFDQVRSRLKDLLEDEEQDLKISKNELEYVINDVLVVCFLGGNDFLPHLPTLDIRKGILSDLLFAYKYFVLNQSPRKFIVDPITNELNREMLQQFLTAVVALQESGSVKLSPEILKRATELVNKDQKAKSAFELYKTKKHPLANRLRQFRPPKSQLACHQISKNKNSCKNGNRCEYLHGDYIPREVTIHRILSNIMSFALTESEKFLDAKYSKDKPIMNSSAKGFRFKRGPQTGTLRDNGSKIALSHLDKIELRFVNELAKELQLKVGNGENGETIISLPNFKKSSTKQVQWALQNREVLKKFFSEELRDLFIARDNYQMMEAFIGDRYAMGSSYNSSKKNIFPKLYYLSKLDYDLHTKEGQQAIRNMSLDFIRGMQWTVRYYLEGSPSWDWSYNHHYAPFAHDLLLCLDNFDEKHYNSWAPSKPQTPIEQLMAVLPARSSHAVPKILEDFMFKEDSPLVEFYPDPSEVDLDPNGKRFKWQWVPLVDGIDTKRVGKVVQETRNKWTKEEKARDRTSLPRLITAHPSIIDIAREPGSQRSRPKTDSTAGNGDLSFFSLKQKDHGLSGEVRLSNSVRKNSIARFDFVQKRSFWNMRAVSSFSSSFSSFGSFGSDLAMNSSNHVSLLRKVLFRK